jgi:hypothetical protein
MWKPLGTPIAFPIEWQSSKIPGWALRASVPVTHGFTALAVMSSVAARFFLPQVAGLPIIPPSTGVFRIDHDELFNSTVHVQVSDALEARTVVRLQLALRQRTRGGCHSLLQPAYRNLRGGLDYHQWAAGHQSD